MKNSEIQKKLDLLENRVKALEEKQKPQHYDFKVGDRVQFKSWEEMEKEFGLTDYDGKLYINVCPCFTKDMRYLCGEFATISEIQSAGFVLLKDFSIRNKDNISYSYSLNMLKPATNEPKCKFKVGDRVKWKYSNNPATIIRNSESSNVFLIQLWNRVQTWVYKNELELYTEPRWTFTDDEKVILKNLPKEYKWIARDENGNLYVYQDKPDKGGECWHSNEIIDLLACFYHLFQSIKWEDEEPCEFRNYI